MSRPVLVTGTSSGIGHAAALALHDRGYTVYATARSTHSVADLAERGVRTLALDVTDEASMRAAVDAVQAEHGALFGLVNNAGYALQGPIEDTPMTDVRAQFETNVFGLVRLTQLALPAMRAAGTGRIVNVGSMGGRFTFPGGGFYHASKHAVEAISDALRLEVAPWGVRVSLVQPGPVASGFLSSAVDSMGTADPHDGDYAAYRAALVTRFEQAYDGRRWNLQVPAAAVGAVIANAVGSARPRARYAVGALARTLITTRRLTPDLVWDRIVRASWPTPTRG